jgi:hypothetical protein
MTTIRPGQPRDVPAIRPGNGTALPTSAEDRLSCAWPAPEGVFMVMELVPGSLAAASGPVSHEPEFDDV